MDLLIIIHLLVRDMSYYNWSLGETLSLDDVVSEDETTQTCRSRAFDEINSSTRCHRGHKETQRYYYVVLFF
jgi:hypothetical protein